MEEPNVFIKLKFKYKGTFMSTGELRSRAKKEIRVLSLDQISLSNITILDANPDEDLPTIIFSIPDYELNKLHHQLELNKMEILN